MAFGGVPIGVAIPPTFAAIGIESANAIFPFPSAGSDLSTGVRNVSIIAAVAVLLRNIENTAVTRMNPRSTKRDCFPKGLRRILARVTSRPLFVAAIARMNPPMKSIIIGSAKQWRISLYETCVARSALLSPFSKNQKLLSDVANNRRPTTAIEVVQAGMASKTHIRIAKPKMAITLC